MNFLFLLLLLPCFSCPLAAATIVVGPPPASIQTAINSASNGDTVMLSAGTYVEQIQVISKSIDIVGAGKDVSIIQAPSATTHLSQNFNFGSNYWCIVMIDNQAAPTAQTVNINNLTVDGSNQQDTVIAPIYGNSDRFFAIGYHNASGVVDNVHTTNMRQTSNFNELAGGGIINASNTGTVSFSVTNSVIDLYQRIGIDCRGSSLTATISDNTVNRGYILVPNTTTATPNGIQFSGSAQGSIVNNVISENVATVFNASATGIIPFGAGNNVLVSGNTLNNNDLGIAAISCGGNLTISDNIVNFTIEPGVNSPEGIVVQDTSGLTTVTGNIMNNIPFINMELLSSTNQSFALMNNQFNGSQTGLKITGNTTTGPIITMSNDSFTGTTGYYIQEDASPNNVWPSTQTVSFDGLLSGHMTSAEFSTVLTKIYDQHNDPSLGLVLDFEASESPTVSSLSSISGPTTGGNVVTVNGSGFISSHTQVFFGTVEATEIEVLSDNEIKTHVPPGTGVVDVQVVTSIGTSPISSADSYTYLHIQPLPPSGFTGYVSACECNEDEFYVLRAVWNSSPSTDVVSYRIYARGRLVAHINATDTLVLKKVLKSALEASHYYIVAVSANNIESTPEFISIILE